MESRVVQRPIPPEKVQARTEELVCLCGDRYAAAEALFAKNPGV